ncbi:hypothetical protein SAMN05216232_2442 [Virgibacillus subterraneus]|uniref:Uncharacterized protein n=2 Tax=Virgibacillus TaxID=84406 RepID=A0A1H1EKF9_9BACI|nr:MULTISPECIES: hypothetical protein [Virgibacillus]SDQ89271.1 hypothetical protein SAMN05216231_2932 [Virgibacillus salinus]SEQ44682.1 hypothetical protein SAMN05216232_2442 [Virgibacillus subterraneus]
MGYILPINHYQYKDYQQRVTEDKQDPYYIEKPYKAMLEAKHLDIARQEGRLRTIKDSGYKLSAVKSPTAEKILADVTGKGHHFSDSI